MQLVKDKGERMATGEQEYRGTVLFQPLAE